MPKHRRRQHVRAFNRKTSFRSLGPVCGALMLTGCLSPIALEHAVMEYNRSVHAVQSEMLLLNIARTKYHLPGHFTTVSSIAATFDFRVDTGIRGLLSTTAQDLIRLDLGGSVSENPTISMIPLQGEEFTKRLLTPLDETKFTFIMQQARDMGRVLRLIADAIGLQDGDRQTTLSNRPSQRDQYVAFRQRVLHLSALHAAGRLTITPIVYEEPWPRLDGEPLSAAELTVAFEHEYRWVTPQEHQPPVLSRSVIGRVLMANYDPADRTIQQRRRLNRDAQRHPRNFIMVDVDPRFPGGDYPLQGWIQLRSVRTMIEFLARGITDDQEFHVDPDPRTGPVTHNPQHTLTIHETASRPDNAAFAVSFGDHVYSIQQDAAGDLDMFRALYRLFQLTMTDASTVPVPAITIGK